MALQALVYQSDIVIKWPAGHAPRPEYTPRGDVVEFSRKSRERLRFVATNTEANFNTLITLTYPFDFPSDGQIVKGHLHKFLGWLCHEYPGQYLWFIEFQRRGAPHFHVLYRPLLATFVPFNKVARMWYTIVGSGDKRHLHAGTRVERIRCTNGAAHYAVKYAQKMTQKRVPVGYRHVGRFWACSRCSLPHPKALCVFEGIDDLKQALASWRYLYVLQKPYIKVLYGATKYLDPMLAAILPFKYPLILTVPVSGG